MHAVAQAMRSTSALTAPALRRSRIFAMAGPADDGAIAALARGVENHAAEVARLSAAVQVMESDIDVLNTKMAGAIVGGESPDPRDAANHELLGIFARQGGQSDFCEFLRRRGQDALAANGGGIKAAMSVGSDPDGGYTVLPTVESTIQRIARDASPLRALARVVTIGTEAYEIMVDPSLVGAAWVGETQSREDTDGSKLVKVRIPVMEIYASPKATQSLLDDSFVDLAAWLTDSVSISFAVKEGAAFVSGDGVGKPFGFLSHGFDSAADFTREWGKLQYVAAGSTTPTASQLSDAIIALSMELRSPYRANAVWVMSRGMARIVRQLRDDQKMLLWSSDGRVVDGVPDRLLGFPIAYDDNMPAPGVNAYPIALGDWRQGYTIVDRLGIRVLRDPYSAKPYVSFYTTKRVGGDVIDSNAIKALKYAAS